MSQFQLEKRFGYIAVNKGFITEEQLAEAMIIQIKQDLSMGTHRLVGQILLSLGYMDEEKIIMVLQTMRFPLNFCSNFIGVAASTTRYIQTPEAER